MRRLLFLLTLFLAACGSNGDGFEAGPELIQHVPEISNLKLSPESALYMQGDGSVVVTAEITFRDIGRDIRTLWIWLPDGTSMEFSEPFATEIGTFTEDFVMPTNKIGAFPVEIWLIDSGGDSSVHRTTEFHVFRDAQEIDWTSRLGWLPYGLNDVTWDGNVFIAVGDHGTVLTSADGINWAAREAGTDADLNAVAAYGSNIFVVGNEIVLLSSDHGANWITKNTPDSVLLTAVAVNASQVVVSGYAPETGQSHIIISENRGDTWAAVGSAPGPSVAFTDLIYRDRLFVAATGTGFPIGGARVQVSSDGKSWHELVLRDDGGGISAIIHDDSQFIATGGFGALFTSFDGFNWTEIQTPVEGVDYLSAAWNGSKLVLAGGYSCWIDYCRPPQIELPVGIASTDGGVTWDIFNIDGYYQSRGLAFGNGRFVSVGRSAPATGKGAIYTAD